MTQLLNPEVLFLARTSRGRTGEEVAKAIGVSKGLISKVENNLVTLPPEKVQEIADFLHFPAQLFFEPGGIRDSGSACLYHRKRKTLPAKLLAQLDARMFIRNINVRHLLRDLEIDGTRMFHTMDPDEYGGSPEEVARALRAAWRIPDGPIQNLTALVESAGGAIVLESFGTQKLFGMSCWMKLDVPLFFLNADAPTEVLRWTLAHEIGHLTMHGVPPTGDPEEEADEFAGEFLAPSASFGPTLRPLTFDRLPQLKAYWRISMKAVITRAKKLGMISPEVSTRLYKRYSALRYNSGEPYTLSPEKPTLLSSAVHVHLQDHEYSVQELADAMRVSSDEMHLFDDDLPLAVGDGVISIDRFRRSVK